VRTSAGFFPYAKLGFEVLKSVESKKLHCGCRNLGWKRVRLRFFGHIVSDVSLVLKLSLCAAFPTPWFFMVGVQTGGFSPS